VAEGLQDNLIEQIGLAEKPYYEKKGLPANKLNELEQAETILDPIRLPAGGSEKVLEAHPGTQPNNGKRSTAEQVAGGQSAALSLPAEMAPAEEEPAASQSILDTTSALSGDGRADRAAPVARATDSSQEGGPMSVTTEEQRLAAEARARQRAADRERYQAGVPVEQLKNEEIVRRYAEAQANDGNAAAGERVAAGQAAVQAYTVQTPQQDWDAGKTGVTPSRPERHAAAETPKSVAEAAEAAELASIAARTAGKPAPEQQEAAPKAEQPAQDASQEAAEASASDAERQRLLDGLNKAQADRDRIEGKQSMQSEGKKPSLADMRAASDRKAAEERQRAQEQGLTGPHRYRGMGM
jgi:hypothetical protein